jgi:hypothetical protein
MEIIFISIILLLLALYITAIVKIENGEEKNE